jgi:methionine-rich copper-binding protein CopC
MTVRHTAVVVSLIVLTAAPAAMSHSGATSSSPKEGSVVSALPATVTITFGDRLLGVTSVRVLDPKGIDHAASARLNPRNAAMVVVRTRRPGAGRYTVVWKVRSEDGHPASGTFRFRVRG